MKHSFLLLGFLALVVCANAQTYTDSINQYRQQYVRELVHDPKQPVKPADVRFLRFYKPDSTYRVVATYEETPGREPFLVPTHSGKEKPFQQCGVLTFTLHDTDLTLHVYRLLNMVNGKPLGDEYFVPFSDLTNYETTYAGGRYIDLRSTDFDGNKVVLDFNKCYNPYCAYGDGFSCPIPPRENFLHIEVRAGDRMFAKLMNE